MNVLIVGAGSVGQVYGYHLQRGGAQVGVLVKPKHVAEAKRGFRLYKLGAPKTVLRFEGLDVYTGAAELGARGWQAQDQVWLCMSSTGLRQPGLRELFEATGDATVVALQPGLDDHSYILSQGLRAERLVSGSISLVSYPAPLGDEKVAEPGTAFWFLPLAPSPFSGARDRAKGVVQALSSGGQPAALRKDVAGEVAFPSAALMVLVTALEKADWSLTRLRGEWSRLAQAAHAMREATAIVEKKTGKKAPVGVRAVTHPLALQALIRMAPKVVPFPFELFFKKHFTKVGDQTRLAMAGYVADGRSRGLRTESLESLEKRLS